MIKKLLALLLLFSALTSRAITFLYSDLDASKQTCTLSRWEGDNPSGVIELPEAVYINGVNYKITKIAPGALDNLTRATEIVIGPYVEQIGSATAFIVGDCRNFNGCVSLRRFSVNAANTSFAATSEGILTNYQGHTLLRVPVSFRPSDGTQVIKISSDIYNIAPAAFDGNLTLTEISLPASLYAFRSNCGFNNMLYLKQFSQNGSETPKNFKIVDGVLYSGDGSELISFPPMRGGTQFYPSSNLKKLGERSMANCYTILEVGLNDIEEIGEQALSGSGITSFSLPYKDIIIGKGALQACPALASILIPRKTHIPDDFARDCLRLSQVLILDVGNTFGDAAFKNCKALKTFSFNVDQKLEGDSIFAGCGFQEVVFAGGQSPAGGINLGSAIFADCPDLELIDLSGINTPSSETAVHIGTGFAAGCPLLKTVKLPRLSYFWASTDSFRPAFGTDSGVEKIVLGAFTIPSQYGAPLCYTASHTSPAIYVCTTDAPRNVWNLNYFFYVPEEAAVRPLIYCDNLSMADPAYGSSTQFIYPNSRYYVPAGAYPNYADAQQLGCSIQEMFDMEYADEQGKLIIKLKNNLGPSRIVFTGATVNSDYYAADADGSQIITTKDYEGEYTIRLEYKVDDVAMKTDYSVKLTAAIDAVAAADKIQIIGQQLLLPGTCQYTIYTLSGTIAAAGQASSADLSTLPAGIYLLKATDTTPTTMVKKFAIKK